VRGSPKSPAFPYDTRVHRWTLCSAVLVAGLLPGCRERSASLVDLLEGTGADQGATVAILDGLRAVTAPLPSALGCDLRLPDEPFLEFSISLRPRARIHRGTVRFSIRLDHGDEDFLVYQEDVRPRNGREWRRRKVNLAAWRGKRVRLRFTAEPKDPDALEHLPLGLEAAWGDPRLTEAKPASRDAQAPPSIVLILVDTLRRDYLGFHGFRGSISPNLDWLAEESVELDNAFSQAPWTKPSIASLFTSLYPDVHGLNNHEGLFGKRASEALTTGILPSDAVTLAEALRDAGYRTAAIVANPWLDPRYGFDQGFDLYRMEETTSSLLDGAREWIRGEEGRPFFLYLHFMDVHGPYDAPEEDFQAMASSPSLDAGKHPPVEDLSRLPPYLQNVPWFEERGIASRGWGGLIDFRLEKSGTVRARYAANVRDFDRRIAPFLNELRSSERNEDTLLVLTSDHGEELLEHGGWDHGFTLYDDQIRVPLLVRLPYARGAGRHVSRAANLIDLMPTLLSAAGAKVPPGAEGRDLSSVLLGEGEEDGAAPSFATISTATKHREGVYAVRTERYKLILDSETASASLFDLAADPGEYRDLSSKDEARVRVRELERLLSRHLDEARRAALRPESAPIPDALQRRLESLGYLER
jgi:arylsulfatase A-like enzyme